MDAFCVGIVVCVNFDSCPLLYKLFIAWLSVIVAFVICLLAMLESILGGVSTGGSAFAGGLY